MEGKVGQRAVEGVVPGPVSRREKLLLSGPDLGHADEQSVSLPDSKTVTKSK